MQQELDDYELARRPTRSVPLHSSITSNLHTNSQAQGTALVATQPFESQGNARLGSQSLALPESSLLPESLVPVNTRPIWRGRPELIYLAYLAETEAWLAPTAGKSLTFLGLSSWPFEAFLSSYRSIYLSVLSHTLSQEGAPGGPIVATFVGQPGTIGKPPFRPTQLTSPSREFRT
jgi:hypothetical protein